MRKKQKKGLRERHLLKAGICFEALEPRLLLSGSWGAVVDGPGPDTQADAHGGLTLKSVMSHAEVGVSGAGNAQDNLTPGSGRVDLLSQASALNTLGYPISNLDASSSSIPVPPVTDIATAKSLADNKAAAPNPEPHADTLDAAIRRELVFVNDNVAAYEILINGIRESDTNRIVEIVVLDADRDGIQQVSDILDDRSDLSAVHFIAHGSDGQINLGNSWLNNTTLQQKSDAVAGWGGALSETGDILFYGCNLVETKVGQNLTDTLSDLTGADVAASDDKTGHVSFGGDWELEYGSGAIEAELVITETGQQNWEGLLATYTVADNFSAGDATGNTGSVSWSGNWITSGSAVFTGSELRVNFVGTNAARQVDLSSATTASLSFDYRTAGGVDADAPADSILVQISSNGGTDWVTLEDINYIHEAFSGTNAGSRTYDISGYTAVNTQIRFAVNVGYGSGTEYFYADNVVITYSDSNSAPVITSNGGGDTASINVVENTTSVTRVTANDADGSDTLAYSINGGVDYNLFAIDSVTGDLSFKTAPDYENPTDDNGFTPDNIYEVRVSVSDGNGGVDTQAISVSVTNVNDAPIIAGSNDLTAIDEDPFANPGTRVSDLISGHVTDADTGALTGIAVIGVDNTNGTWQFTSDGGGIWTPFGTPTSSEARLLAADADTYVRFVPDANWNGTLTDGLTFHAWDQTTGTNGNTADITNTYTLLDQFSTVSYSNNDGSANWTSDWVEANDDGSPVYLDASDNIFIGSSKLHIDNLDAGAFSSITRAFDLIGTTTATLTMNYDGIREGVVGGDRFTVEVSDDGGATWALLEEITVPGETTANLPFSGSLSYTLEDSVTLTNNMVLRLSISAGFGGTNQHVNFDNVQIEYSGSTAFSVDSASSSIIVNPVNDAPLAVDDTITATEDTLFTSTVDLDFNDTDLDGDGLSVVAGSFATAQGGSLVLAADGSYTYTPAANFTGIDTVDYTVTDGTLTDVGTLTITVNPLNDAPTVTAVNLGSINEDGSLLITQADLLTGSADADGDSLTAINLVVNSGSGTLTDHGDGTWTFTPTANWNGAVSFDFEVSDGTTTTANTASLTVTAVNDAPVAVDDAITATEDTLFTSAVDLDVNDTDLDGDSLTVVAGTFATTQGGSLVLAADGSYTYTPAANFTGIDTVDYTVTDGTLTDVGTLTITVNPLNDAPTVTAVNLGSINEDGSLLITQADLLTGSADADGDSLTAINLVVNSGSGTLTDHGDGTWTFTPTANWNGAVSFDFEVSDGTTTTANTASLTVTAVNDAPVAVDDAITATEDTLFTSAVDLDVNDTDLDGDSLTVVAGTFATTQGGSLVLAADGSYTYTPAANFTGIDTVDYTVTDGTLTDVGTLTITVNPLNDAPTVTAVNLGSINEDGSLLITQADLLTGSADADGDSLTAINLVVNSGSGTLTDHGDGTWTFTPTANWNGAVSFDFEVSDGTTTTANTASLTVTAVNDAPVAVDDAITATEDTLFTSAVDLDVNDTDLDGDSLTVVAGTFATTQGGSLVLAADGSYTYTPAANFTGIDTVDYTVTDGTLTDVGTLTITVNPLNDAPVISGSDTGAVTKNIDPDGDGLIEVGGVLTISDPDIAESSFQAGIINGAYGSLTIDAAGNWSYAADNTQAVIQQLNTGESISDVLTVTTADGTTHSIVVTINGATAIVDPGGDDPGPDPGDDPIEPDPEPDPELTPEEILPIEDELPPREELAISNLPSSKPPVLTPQQWGDPTYFVPTISLLKTDNGLPTDAGSPSAMASIVKYLQRELASHTIARFAPNVSALFSTEAMTQTLDHLQQQLGQTLEMDGKRGQLIIGAATGMGASVFAGYVIWALRGSSLLVGALTAMPMWRCFDPLPVLMGNDKKPRDRDEAKSTGNDLDNDEIKVKEMLGEKQTARDVEG